MANSSIFAAFERMWQYTIAALDNKFNYAMPKFNEGIPTYQNDPEFEGKNYCVDIPDLTELKVGTEITIIPHVTSTITGI